MFVNTPTSVAPAIEVPRHRRGRALLSVTAAALLLVASAAGARSASAATPAGPTLSSAAVVLPSGQAGDDVFVSKIECPAAGSCYAGGQAENRGASTQIPFLNVLSGGKWSGVPITPPKGSAQSSVVGLSCPKVGECYAIVAASSAAPAGTIEAFAMVLHAGSWTRKALPAGVLWSSVTCPAAQQCVLRGTVDSTQAESFLIVNGSKTTQRPGATIPGAPADALVARGLTCTSTKFCIEWGDSSYGTDSHAYAEQLVDGTASGFLLPVPAGGSGPSGVLSVTCSAPGSCTGYGHYTVSDGTSRVMSQTLSGGTVQAADVPLPASASAALGGAPLSAVSCATTLDCAGLATVPSSDGKRNGVVLSADSGTITSHTIAVPGSYTDVNAVACPAVARCLVTGDVITTHPQSGPPTDQGFVGLLIDGALTMSNISGPPDVNSTGSGNGTLAETIGCAPSADFCVVEGAVSGSTSFAGYYVTVQ